MSGNYSRLKGKRNEYLLRDSLRAEGYEAHRVPSSGAADGFKGDVEFSRAGQTWVAELKVRHMEFKAIYALMEGHDKLAYAVPAGEHVVCVSVSRTMEDAINGLHVYEPIERHSGNKAVLKAVRKLTTIAPMLGKSDILVVKDDRKPFLYVRYR